MGASADCKYGIASSIAMIITHLSQTHISGFPAENQSYVSGIQILEDIEESNNR